MRGLKGYLCTAVFATLLCASVSASAQTMYRCGNAYQDQPCSGAKAGTVVGNSGRSAAAGATSASAGAATLSDGAAAMCRQRGIDAEKIMWAREGGKTLEQQLEDPRTGSNAGLVNSVYQRRGTAAEVRAAVERDCIAEQARALEAARLNAAAQAILAGNPSPDLANAPAKATPDQSAAVPTATDNGASATRQALDAHRQQCTSLAAQAANIAQQQRRGGSFATMDGLETQSRSVGAQQREAGC